MKFRMLSLLAALAAGPIAGPAPSAHPQSPPQDDGEPQLAPQTPPRTPVQSVAEPESGPLQVPGVEELGREPLVQGPYQEVPVVDRDDGVPLPTFTLYEPGSDRDEVVRSITADPDFLAFAGGSYHPLADEKVDPELVALVAAGTDDGRDADELFAFVMFSKRITPARVAQLEALGVRSLGLHPHYTLKVAVPTGAVDLVANLPFVRWVGVPRTYQKVHPELAPRLSEAGASDLFDVWVAVVDSDLTARSTFRSGVRPEDVDPTGLLPSAGPPQPFEARTNGWQERALELAGLQVFEYTEGSRSFRCRASRSDLEALLSRDFVQFIGPDVPAVPLHDESMAMVSADRGRSFFDGNVNAEIVVGVLDTGMTHTHQGFSPVWVTGWDFTGEGAGAFNEGFAHGSHVMGSLLGRKTVEGSLAGAAPGVATQSAAGRLFNLKIFDSGGTTGGVNWNSVYNVMTSSFNSAPRPHILNHSWGSVSTPGGWFGTESQAVDFDDEAFDHRQLHVFASGNWGPGASTVSLQASAKNVLTVGSVVDYDSPSVGLPGNLWSSSSRGPTADNRWKPNVVAPGRQIMSIRPNTVNEYYNLSGTSMAAPHVSGIAAQLNDHHDFVRYKPYVAAAILMATALPKDDTSIALANDAHLDEYGAGRVDAYRGHYSTSQHELSFWGWPTATGASTLQVDVPVSAGATRITAVMTYHEAGASVGAAQALINDWDMWIDRAPFTAGGNTGEYFAHQSSRNNTELRMIDGPTPGTHRIKLYPDSVVSNCRMGLAVVVTYGDTTPDGTLNLSASDSFVQPGDLVDITATARNPEYTASAVFLDSIVSFPNTLHASSTTLKDGEVTDLLGNQQGGFDVLLGNIRHGRARTANWTVSWGFEGHKTWRVDASSDNWVDKSAQVQITVDGTPPALVTNLSSTSHTPNVWSNEANIDYTWTAATDALSGVAGYGIFTSTSSTTPPSANMDLGPVTSHSESLSTNALGYWFKIRTVDNSTNWTPGFELTGPYLIDTLDPSSVSGLDSSSHQVGVANCDTALTTHWTAATDGHSGIAGYLVAWDASPGTDPVGVMLPSNMTQTTQVLPAGDWYFHVRAVDQAGNRGPTSHAGPYTIDDSPWSTYCTAKVNSLGCVPGLSATGTPSLSASTFQVQGDELLNSRNGILFWGLEANSAPFQGGTLCVKSPIRRTPVQSTGGSLPPANDCTGTLSWSFTSAYMASKGITAGADVFCQIWTRDQGVPSGTNLTDGLQFKTCP